MERRADGGNMTGIPVKGVRFIPILAFALCVAVPCHSGPSVPPDDAESGVDAVQSGVLVPRDVYVGDEAEFTFEAVIPAGVLEKGATLSVTPTGMNQDSSRQGDVTVLSAMVREKDGRALVVVRFIPWISGIVGLPPVIVGGHEIPCPPLSVASLLDPAGQTALQPPRYPMLVPGTTYLLYGIILAILFFLLLAFFVVRRVGRYLGSDFAAHASSRRSRLLFRRLAWLERRIARIPPGEWYARFSLELRRYLGLYTAGSESSFLSATGRELQGMLGDVESAPVPLADFFDGIDRARFSGQPYAERRKADLDAARELCRSLEGRLTDAVL